MRLVVGNEGGLQSREGGGKAARGEEEEKGCV